ncbi:MULTISPECIES: lipopolysaccharide assembly protein LapA domain-containing protein [unclassified Desulfurobacterium]|uniref:lipopolysaccharide assembly protein LapA domain-containing protein n=1 Tax=Desulfurobacterium sp. TC5-1 TaxID=1158318 RepID=UPI0003B3C438|nr:lipopolysaccharide assembly protein LapA domain-containing protein [Desulfurobacterium sp. TC5-1]
MTFKQLLYSIFIAAIVIAVSLFALSNFQDVNVVIPFVGAYKTKLFMLIIISYIAGFLTAAFLSLLTRLFSISFRRGKKSENRSVSETFKDNKEEKSGEDTV